MVSTPPLASVYRLCRGIILVCSLAFGIVEVSRILRLHRPHSELAEGLVRKALKHKQQHDSTSSSSADEAFKNKHKSSKSGKDETEKEQDSLSRTIDPTSLVSFDEPSSDPDGFFAANVDFESAVPCGMYKCFYRIKSNPEIGYLIVDAERVQLNQSLSWQWNLMVEMIEAFPFTKHLFLEDPLYIQLPPQSDWGAKLSQHAYQPSHLDRDTTQRFVNTKVLEVQKVQIADMKSSFEFGCLPSKRAIIEQEFPQFLESVTMEWDEFVAKLTTQINARKTMLHAAPKFAQDFQLLIDRQANVYQIDVSVTERGLEKKLHMCDRSFDVLLDALQDFHPSAPQTKE